jgi:NADP-dependent alcohol dehydrogenase
LPPAQIANGVADAFVQVIEQYLTCPGPALAQDRFAEGSEKQRIDAAMTRTRQFFEVQGIQTRLSDAGLGLPAIDLVIAQLDAHGMTRLGEHQNVTLDVSRTLIEEAL